MLNYWETHQSASAWGIQLAELGPGWWSGTRRKAASWFCCCHLKERQQGCGCLWVETGEEERKWKEYYFTTVRWTNRGMPGSYFTCTINQQICSFPLTCPSHTMDLYVYFKLFHDNSIYTQLFGWSWLTPVHNSKLQSIRHKISCRVAIFTQKNISATIKANSTKHWNTKRKEKLHLCVLVC